LRFGLVPLLSMVGMSFPFLFSNLILIEGVFEIHGLGGLLEFSLWSRAYGTTLDLVFAIGIITVLANLLTDILTAAVDPRIRFQ
jgi:peptide/nickel transport system permease protein